MMSLYRIAVLLMCACVVTSDVIANDEEGTVSSTATVEEVITTIKPVTATESAAEVAAKFAEFIADWTPSDTADNETISSPQHASDKQLEYALYESVYYYNYDKAVQQCKDIVKQDRKNIIKATVDHLIKEKKSQTTEFAYKLWEAKGAVVVEQLFPAEFEMVFNDSLVIPSHYWFSVPIELGFREDSNGDKYVYSSDKEPIAKPFVWKIYPVFVEKRIYFKIRHHDDGRYLKLAEHTDRSGHYLAYGAVDSDTRRHLWMLQPARYDNMIVFFLVNRHHYQALTLANNAYDGSRKAFGARGDFYNHPQWYGWRVQLVKQGGGLILG